MLTSLMEQGCQLLQAAGQGRCAYGHVRIIAVYMRGKGMQVVCLLVHDSVFFDCSLILIVRAHIYVHIFAPSVCMRMCTHNCAFDIAALYNRQG